MGWGMPEHIRRACPEERDRISEVRFAVQENQLSDPSLVTDADYKWFRAHPPHLGLGRRRPDPGGFRRDTRDGTIWALFVDPTHHHRGIGRALCEAACEVLSRAGHHSATLTTEPGTGRSASTVPPAGPSSAPASAAN